MATVVEQRSQPVSNYDYDHMRVPASSFNNPWGQAGPQYYAQNSAAQSQQLAEQYARQSYSAAPATPQDTTTSTQPRSFPAEYSSATDTSPYSAPSSDRIPQEQFPQTYAAYDSRYPVQFPSQAQPQASRQYRPTMAGRDFSDAALDASHGMVQMRQQDFTPRCQYAPRHGSSDSYGFPSGQSDHGSTSSVSSYPYYGSYNNSVEGSVAGSSVTDYSSASEDLSQRTLPPPGQLLSGFPADANAMMTQFNSKLASSAQKKHKCKICDKRFTRPSSLQTHMYSHTGEKPFACDFEGCGRHFSVVSNLRRHKKCHKGEGVDSTSPEA